MGHFVVRSLVLVLAILACMSCATFREGNLAPIGNWPPTASGNTKHAITVKVATEMSINGTERLPGDVLTRKWHEHIILAYRDSKLFSSVEFGPDAEQAPVIAHATLRDDGTVSLFMAVLTGLTLYVIPSSATDQFTLTTRFMGVDGNELGVITKTESGTLWQQLFMIFLAPGRSINGVADEILRDLNRATILEAKERGFI